MKKAKKEWNDVCEALNRDVWGQVYNIITRRIGEYATSTTNN